MEAITAIKIPERPGTLEESGPEAVEGLFAQVLAGQKAVTGQGQKPAAGNPEVKGLKPGHPVTGEALPADSLAGNPSEIPPLMAVATVLPSGLVPEGLAVPAALEAEPGVTALPEEGKGSGAFSLPPFPPPTAGPADQVPIPDTEPGEAFSKRGLVRTAPNPERPGPVLAAADYQGPSGAAPVAGPTGRPPDATVAPPAGPEDYPTIFGPVGTPEVLQETPRPIRPQPLSPETRIVRSPEILGEISPTRENRSIRSDGKPVLAPEIPTGSLGDHDFSPAPPPTQDFAEASAAPLRIKDVPGPTREPEYRRIGDTFAPNPPGLPSRVREPDPGFSPKEIERIAGEKDQSAPAAPSRPVAHDVPGAFKTVRAEAPEASRGWTPRDPTLERESLPDLSAGAGALGDEGEVPAPAEGKFAIPPEGSPGPKAAMLPGTEMTAVHPLERQRPETASKINGPASSAAFTDRAEERQPLFRQVSRGLVWSLHRGEEKIQITLDPPHLGTIFLELHRNRQTVEAQVWTDNPATKGLLDTQQGQLHKALEQEGFRLDRFEVAVQSDLKSFSEERFAQGRQPAWEEPRNQGHRGGSETAWSGEPERPIRLFQHGNRYIDTWI